MSAEIPKNERLKKLVTKHMLHGPHIDKSPCLQKNKEYYTENFPKKFQEKTTFKTNGYPDYKRVDNSSEGHTYDKKGIKNIPVNNSMVVQYNPYCLLKYECHINLEYCASIASLKYIFDYIHEGSNRAHCEIKKTTDDNSKSEEKHDEYEDDIYDELSQHVDGRYLSPMDAAWRALGFPLCGRSQSSAFSSAH